MGPALTFSDSRCAPIPLGRKILIVGADSVLGAALEKQLAEQGYPIVSTTRQLHKVAANRIYLDLYEPATFSNLGRRPFDIAVLCAAITSVQACEERPNYTTKINVKGTIALANLLSKAGTHLIFLSTNMVFDGSEPHYGSDDLKKPATEYGKQKAMVEDWLLSICSSVAIIRFGKVLPPQFQLFAQWHKDLISGNKITPYLDKTMAPISLEMAIKILSWLIAVRQSGIFQATASSDITYTDAALYLASLWNVNPGLIQPIASSCQVEAVRYLDHRNIFNTLQISAEFKHLFSGFDPLIAVHYSRHY